MWGQPTKSASLTEFTKQSAAFQIWFEPKNQFFDDHNLEMGQNLIYMWYIFSTQSRAVESEGGSWLKQH